MYLLCGHKKCNIRSTSHSRLFAHFSTIPVSLRFVTILWVDRDFEDMPFPLTYVALYLRVLNAAIRPLEEYKMIVLIL